MKLYITHLKCTSFLNLWKKNVLQFIKDKSFERNHTRHNQTNPAQTLSLIVRFKFKIINKMVHFMFVDWNVYLIDSSFTELPESHFLYYTIIKQCDLEYSQKAHELVEKE